MTNEKSLLARVQPLVQEYDMLPAGGVALCCVSGGVDSMVLLHLLCDLSRRQGAEFTLHACHVDHGIRPESGNDAAFVAEQCKALEVPLHTTRANVPEYAKANGMGLEETGRKLRYDYFNKIADELGGAIIATAHHADDNAETLLLHLVRGTGLTGLGGIPPRRDNLVRPLLRCPRVLLEAYAEEKGIPHVEDASNADTAYTRNFLRHQVMPLLKQMNPNLTDTLTATAESLREDGAFLTARAETLAMDAALAAGSVILPVANVTTAPTAIAGRVLQAAVRKLEPELVLTAAQRQALMELCRGSDPSGHCDLPMGVSAQRVYDRLVFSRPGEVEVLPEAKLDFIGTREIGPYSVTVEPAVCPENWRCYGQDFYLSADSPITLRPRKIGDEMKSAGRQGTKTVKKWMIEKRIPEARRDLIPVLEQNGRCVAVWSIGVEESAIPEIGQPCIYITIKEKERKQTV